MKYIFYKGEMTTACSRKLSLLCTMNVLLLYMGFATMLLTMVPYYGVCTYNTPIFRARVFNPMKIGRNILGN